MSRVAILTPFHKSSLSPDESLVVRRYREVLRRYPRFVVAPTGMDRGRLLEHDPDLGFEEFDPSLFQSFRAHQQFCMSGVIWDRFRHFDYVLIAHYDAWVFSDELLDWTDRGWPYIGTVWPGNRSWLWHQLVSYCGGGGFSLRRVDWMRQVCRVLCRLAVPLSRYNEDAVFASLMARTLGLTFKKPGLEEGLRFGFEVEPVACLRMTGGRLPFGCHGWTWPDRRAFWSQFIPCDGEGFQ